MQFSEILGSMTQADGVWSANVSDAWLQGRSVFGGLQGALALRPMWPLVPPGFALRVFQAAFVAPIPAGEVRARTRLLRTGKSTAHVETRLLAGEDTAALVVCVFGASRPSRVRVTPERPAVQSPSPFDFRYVSGLSPTFTQHFAIRWLAGGLPFTASSSPEAVAELGMPGESAATAEHVLALADVMPPVALSYLDAPARGSSATWTVEMLTDSVSDLSPHGFRVDATLVAAGDGYTSQSVMVWGPGGEPVALSRQSMVVFG